MGLLSILFYERPLFVHRPVGPLDPAFEEKFAECGMKNKNSIPCDLSFERLIENQIMPPTSLLDFMNYLVYIAHDAENLQFYLWLRDYKKKFAALRKTDQALSPEWIATEAPPPEPQKLMQMAGLEALRKVASSESFRASEDSFGKCRSMQEVVEDANVQAGLVWQPFTVQPLRDEATRVAAHYIVPGSPRELNLSQKDRAAVLHALQHTTHPSAFEPAATVVEMTLRGQSHPNFIRWAIGNGTRPRTIFGRALGAFITFIGVLAAILLTLSDAPRWYRALATIPFALGVFFVIGTRQGLCPLLYAFGNATQLQPWERPDSRSSPVNSRIAISWKGKALSDEEATIASTTELASMDRGKSAHSIGGGSSYTRVFDPFGFGNDFSHEDWVEPYRRRVFWKNIFAAAHKTEEKQVRLIRDWIFYQCCAWTVITAPVFTAIFLAVPGGHAFG